MEWGSYIQGALGGLLIGLSAVTLMASLGRIAGISGMVSGLIFDRFTAESAWRLAFVLGLLSGPLLLVVLVLATVAPVDTVFAVSPGYPPDPYWQRWFSS